MLRGAEVLPSVLPLAPTTGIRGRVPSHSFKEQVWRLLGTAAHDPHFVIKHWASIEPVARTGSRDDPPSRTSEREAKLERPRR